MTNVIASLFINKQAILIFKKIVVNSKLAYLLQCSNEVFWPTGMASGVKSPALTKPNSSLFEGQA